MIPAELQRMVENAEPPQDAWLVDGRVTNAEMEEAFLAAVACTRGVGAAVEAEYLGAGDYLVSASAPSEAAVNSAQEAADRCFRDTFELTASVYAALYAPSAKDRADAEALFVQCANGEGFFGSSREEISSRYEAGVGLASISHCSTREAEYLRQITMGRADADDR